MSKLIIFLYILLLSSANMISQNVNPPDTLGYNSVRVFPLPNIGKTVNSKTYLGLSALFNIDVYKNGYTRTSNANLNFKYSFNSEYLVDFGWNYFFNHEKWFSKGRIHHSRFPDYYFLDKYGHSRAGKEYISTRHIGLLNVYRKVTPILYAGIILRYISYHDFKSDVIRFNFLEQTVRGIGAGILIDTRNSILTPSEGYFLDLAYNYNHFVLDARMYKQPSKNSVFSFRLYHHWMIPHEPFFDLAIIGGDQLTRGFYYGKYSDKNLASLQLELRLPLNRKISAAIFCGVTDLYDSRSDFINNFFYNYGIGLRIQVDRIEGTNLRIDYAIGTGSDTDYGNDSGWYITFGESF